MIIGISILGVTSKAYFVDIETIKFPSQSGKNELVVINSDFLRVTHYAYPVKFKWFYKQQYNGYVAIHDDYGGAEYDVNWITENKAVVKIIYFFPDMPDREGSNPDREITVTFK